MRRLAIPHDEVLVLATLLDIARTQQLVRIGTEEEYGVGPVLQEVLVIELLANDVVHPGKAHQTIGVGIGLQPLVGLPDSVMQTGSTTMSCAGSGSLTVVRPEMTRQRGAWGA